MCGDSGGGGGGGDGGDDGGDATAAYHVNRFAPSCNLRKATWFPKL
jgi:hypothetical protein